jgi:hypothetical protein
MISSLFNSNSNNNNNNNTSNKKLNDIDENKLMIVDDNKNNFLIYNDIYINNNTNQFQVENEINFSNYEKLRLKLTSTHLILQTKNLKFLINNEININNNNDLNDSNNISEYQQFAFANSILQSENEEKVFRSFCFSNLKDDEFCLEKHNNLSKVSKNLFEICEKFSKNKMDTRFKFRQIYPFKLCSNQPVV